METTREQNFSIDGTDVRIVEPLDDEAAARPSVLLFNGIGAGVDHWGKLLEALQRPAIAINVAGARAVGHWATMEAFAESAVDVLDELTDKPMAAVGYSWGGLLLQQLVLDNPHKFPKIVLAATLPGVQCGLPSYAALTGLASPNRSLERLCQIAPAMYGGDIARNPELVKSLNLARTIDKTTYRKQQVAVMHSSIWNSLSPWGVYNNIARLEEIESQTLIMAGDDDPIAPLVNARVMRQHIPGSQLHVEPGGGHGFLLTRPEESAATINDFLR